jgi:phosphoribosylformimino-5-aminoimidazole carboxamide ribotide isomerase
MNLYPAIDILEGQAVRLRQGRREEATVYGSPLEMALRWRDAGARWLHIVDLDGAFSGEPRNAAAIDQICGRCEGIRVQVGGGVRSMEAVETVLDAGAARVILGTAAVRDPKLLSEALERFGEAVAVGLDARDGTVRLQGWTSDAGAPVGEVASGLERQGVKLVIYTDIARDGELGGVNVDATERLLEATGLEVIASGGVAGREDILRLQRLEHPRLEGAIIGKALYEGRIDLADALGIVEAGHAR